MELQLTLLHATTMQPLSDAHNPRSGEGLFKGTGGKRFQTTVLLTDKSTHTFECKVVLMSSDIGGALVKIKVAPPGLAAADTSHPLCVVTRPFRSRARSDKSDKKSKDKFRSLSAGGGDEGAVFRSLGSDDDDGGMVFRSAPNEDDDGDEEDELEDEEDEEEEVDEEEEEEEDDEEDQEEGNKSTCACFLGGDRGRGK